MRLSVTVTKRLYKTTVSKVRALWTDVRDLLVDAVSFLIQAVPLALETSTNCTIKRHVQYL